MTEIHKFATRLRGEGLKKKLSFNFIVWILLGVAIVISQVEQPLYADQLDIKTEQSDQSDQESSDETRLVIAADLAINSISGLNLHQELYQIREIILDDVADPHIVHLAQNHIDSDHFRTLFRNVISANAP